MVKKFKVSNEIKKSVRLEHNMFISNFILWILLSFILTGPAFLTADDIHHWQRTNPGGGGAFSTIGASASGIIFAGSDLSGVYRSFDGGNSWDVLGINVGIEETHIAGFGFDPFDGNIAFVGTESGIYRTVDGGDSFVKVFDSGYITDIEMARSNPQIGYAAYRPAYDNGNCQILKSQDNGQSWQLISQDFPPGEPILKLVCDPHHADIVYALTGKSRFVCGPARLYKSTNGGQNWQRLAPELGSIMDVAVDPNNGQVLYLTTYHATCSLNDWGWTDMEGALYRSLNQGMSWHKMTDRTGVIFLDPDTSGLMRLLDPREINSWREDAGTWTSSDSGHTFTHTGFIDQWDCGYNGIYDPAYATHSTYGVSFNGICQTLGTDLSDSDVILWVNSQFSFRSTDNGTTFKNTFTREVSEGWWQSTGFDNIDMMDLAIHPANNNIIFIGLFDVGLWRSLDHGQSWQSCNNKNFTGSWEEYGGNTATIVVDPVRTNVVWATMSEFQEGEDPTYLVRSDDTGAQESWVLSNTNLPTVEVMGLSIDPNSPVENRTLFVTAQGDVYRSQDDGHSWEKVLENNGLRFTAVDYFNSDLVYAGGGAGFWRSVDGGNTWHEVGTAEMHGNVDFWDSEGEGVFDIQPDPHQSQWVYVTVYGTGKGLWRSKDGGLSWQKLLQDDFMRKVAISPLDQNLIYATSSSAFTYGGYDPASNGVLYSKDGGNSWQKANEGMAWPFALCVKLDTMGFVFVGSPGTGFQKARVPAFSAIKKGNGNPVKTCNLKQNFPNPFNHSTKIAFDLPAKSSVRLEIFNLTGKKISTLTSAILRAGHHAFWWHGRDEQGLEVPSGIYFYRLTVDHNQQIRRMLFLK